MFVNLAKNYPLNFQKRPETKTQRKSILHLRRTKKMNKKNHHQQQNEKRQLSNYVTEIATILNESFWPKHMI